jgi:eukaryotic-like serine/threonine-protein kinase
MVATVTERLTTALNDRYRIERELGQGGMATVYLAHDVKHERRVALKVLHPELAAVLGEERFLAEIRTTAHLQHPHILPLFDSGSADGLLYYVMPFVDGESLRGRLAREKQLPIDNAVAIARGIAAALDHAHRLGVIHRDIKPENVLLQDGQPLVADFGIALAVSHAGGARLTQTGLSLGTPQYMSPEQATGERTIDARTDLYSLGAVTYEMLVGEPPHTGGTSHAIIARILTEKPRAIRASRPNVPVHLAQAVERALEKLPADRFVSAREFAAALEDRASSATIGADTRTDPVADRETIDRSKRRRIALAPWAAAAVLAVIAALGWLRPRGTAPPVPHARFALVLPESAQLREDFTGANIALSPDGTRLVYVGGLPEARLFIRDVDGLEPRAIPGTEGALSPRFSPDGQSVSFTLGRQLKKIPVSGGAAVTIAEGVARYSWGDGNVVVFSRGSGGLQRVSAGGGPVQRVTTLDTARNEATHSWPEVLPGGRAAVFTIHSDSVLVLASTPELAAVRFEDGEIVRLGVHGTNPRYVGTGHLLFGQADGGSIAAVPFDARRLRVTGPVVRVLEGVVVKAGGATEIAISPNGTLAYVEVTGSQLVTVDRSGVARPILTGRGRYVSPRRSPTGDRIALGIRETGGPSDVWVYTPSSGTLTRLTNDGKSTSQSWTHDGRRIAWLFSDDRRRQVRRQAWDGSGTPETLVGTERDFRGVAFSPRSSVFASANAAGLWVTDAEQPSQSRLVVNLPGRAYQPEISADGKWLAYRSAESGRSEVYVTSVASGGRHQVSTNGGSEPAWSADGRSLFYRAGGRFIAALVTTEPGFAVLRRETLFRDVYLQGVERTNYDVSPDGKEFLLVRRREDQQRAVLVFGWLGELRERMAQAAGN